MLIVGINKIDTLFVKVLTTQSQKYDKNSVKVLIAKYILTNIYGCVYVAFCANHLIDIQGDF